MNRLTLVLSSFLIFVSSTPTGGSGDDGFRWGGYGGYGGYGGGLSSVSVIGGVFPLPCDCLSRCVRLEYLEQS